MVWARALGWKSGPLAGWETRVNSTSNIVWVREYVDLSALSCQRKAACLGYKSKTERQGNNAVERALCKVGRLKSSVDENRQDVRTSGLTRSMTRRATNKSLVSSIAPQVSSVQKQYYDQVGRGPIQGPCLDSVCYDPFIRCLMLTAATLISRPCARPAVKQDRPGLCVHYCSEPVTKDDYSAFKQSRRSRAFCFHQNSSLILFGNTTVRPHGWPGRSACWQSYH